MATVLMARVGAVFNRTSCRNTVGARVGMAEESLQRKTAPIAIPTRARFTIHSHILRDAGHEVWRMEYSPFHDDPSRHTSCPYRIGRAGMAVRLKTAPT